MNYRKTSFIIEKSPLKTKKYRAYLKTEPNGKHIDFGAIKTDGTPYYQYRDNTPLKLYKDFNHNDKARRDRYIQRHKNDIVKGFNAGYLSKIFLW